MRTWLTLTLTCLLFNMGFAQIEQNQFVSFRVIGIDGIEDCRKIDVFMRNQKGIDISRTDLNTERFFCTFSSNTKFNEKDFTKWLKNMGYNLACFTVGTRGVDTPPANFSTCGEYVTKRNEWMAENPDKYKSTSTHKTVIPKKEFDKLTDAQKATIMQNIDKYEIIE
jgi:hypothetical protein